MTHLGRDTELEHHRSSRSAKNSLLNRCISISRSVNAVGPTGGSNAAISDDGHFVAYETTLAGVSQILLAATRF
jgi:hypothetical protein